MDNISHSLASLAVSYAFCELPQIRKQPEMRPAIFLTSFIANNLPDLDSVFAYFIQPGHLGNLLNHRGYTHTFVFVPVGAVISLGLAWLFLRKRWRPSWSRPAAQVGLAGILLHLFMDFWNDYGIHPFWPFSNRWIYGDMLNVIEPLFWFSLLPLAWELSKKSRLRYGVMALGAAMLALSWFAPYTRGAIAVVITIWALLAFWFQNRFRGVVPALSTAGVLIGICTVCSFQVHMKLANEFRNEKILQLVAAPAAGDPLCWRVIVVSEREKNYSMRLGAVSLAPEWIAPRRCWYGVFGPHNVPLTPMKESTEPGIAWVGEFVRPVSEFESLRSRSCEFAQILRFARAPFWDETSGGTLIGDLRYDRGTKRGFAELYLKDADGCLQAVPPWEPPVRIEPES